MNIIIIIIIVIIFIIYPANMDRQLQWWRLLQTHVQLRMNIHYDAMIQNCYLMKNKEN